MRRFLPPAGVLFATPLLSEYGADPDITLQKRLLAMIDEAPFLSLSNHNAGRPGWPATVLLRALVLQREKVWHDRELVQQLQDNTRVRYLVGLPLGTRTAPSRTAIGDFRRSLVAAGLGTEIFDQQVNWLGRLPELVNPQKDDFGIDATRFEAAVAQPTIIGLLQHGVRRLLLAVRTVAPQDAAALGERLGLSGWLRSRFQRYGSGIQSRAARREWARCYRKATQLIRAIKPLRDRGMVAEAADVLQRIMDERGPTGTDKPADRLTNALDTEVRFGCKGKGNHKITWHGGKVSVITHLATDLIVAVDVMPANAVDGSAMARCNDQAKALLQGRRIRRLHGDSAYADEDHRCQMAGRDTILIGPRRGKVRRGRVRGGGLVATKIDRGKRAHIERAQANMVRWRGNRRAWYLGLAKGLYQSALSAYTANLARIRSLIAAGKVQVSILA
jgi:transposase